MILRLSTFLLLVAVIAVLVSPVATIYSLIKGNFGSVLTGIIVFIISLFLLKFLWKRYQK